MARKIPRFLDTNRAQAAATIITASSYDVSFPPAKLKDQSLGATWRSAFGWTIVTGFNERLDFKEAGVARLATIAAGNYTTGTAMATAVQTAMNAAPGHTNTYTVTYSALTKQFSIARATGSDAIELSFLTGANPATSVHLDLGYTTTDKTGATSYNSENAAYQSRHYLLFDMVTAQGVTAVAVLNHNLGTGGTITAYAKNANNPWSTPGAGPTALSVASGMRSASFATVTLRYWAIVVNDVQNTVGFAELGIAAPFTYRELLSGYSPIFVKRIGSLSLIERALSGAILQTRRPDVRDWSMQFGPGLKDADRLTLEAIFAAVPIGTLFPMFFDATGDITNNAYVFFDQPMEESYAQNQALMITVHLSEALP